MKQKKIFFRLTFLSLFTIFFSVFNSFSYANQIRNLTILAEPSMVNTLTNLARIYSQRNGVIVSVGFSSSSDLLTEIESGEPADVFISSHPDWLANLKQKGLIDIYNISHIASDELVLVTSPDNLSTPQNSSNKNPNFDEILQSLSKEKLNLIIDDEYSSLGKYSAMIVNSLNLEDLHIFKKLAEDKSSITTLLQAAPNNYAILLSSQVKDGKYFKILARRNSPAIFYQALVIAGDNMDVAREFIKFLKTPQAKEIFLKNSFLIE